MLYQVNYQELKSLVLQYPYAPNLRTLLVLKNLLDNHKDYDHNLTLASVYSIDRKKLRELIKLHDSLRGGQENFAFGEDFLELKDLSAIEDVVLSQPEEAEEKSAQEQVAIEDIVAGIESIGTENFEEEPSTDEKEELDFLENLAGEAGDSEGGSIDSIDVPPAETGDSENSPDEVDVPEASEPAILTENMASKGEPGPLDTSPDNVNPHWNCIADMAAVALVIEAMTKDSGETTGEDTAKELQLPTPNRTNSITLEITNEEEVIHPVPKTSFNSWLKQFPPPEVHSLSVHFPDKEVEGEDAEEAVDDPLSPVKDEAREVAARSIAEDFGVASETLAALLESQGLYDKAIDMYERLCLQYPEKNSFFAAKIESLRNK